MQQPFLAIDLGGTKTSVALVRGGEILQVRQDLTPRHLGAEAWIAAICDLAADWSGHYAAVGLALTGSLRDGRWYALNEATLPVPAGFPVVERLIHSLGVPVAALNDGQAAAWGEYRHGAGIGLDLVFITVSTGVGGGIVLNGRLQRGRNGLAGHVGICPIATPVGERLLEEVCSGSALKRQSEATGRPCEPSDIFLASQRGEIWASVLIDRAIEPMARAIRGLQLVLDPDVFVIGGGIGLATGYLDRLASALATIPQEFRPQLRAAALGANAGLVGVADFVHSVHGAQERRQ
jgi:predicted NBD/HSP70 family sugar kinase